MATSGDVLDAFQQYVTAYLDGFPGVEACLQIVQAFPREVSKKDAVKDILLCSLDRSEDVQRAAICLLTQLCKAGRLQAEDVAKAFEQMLSELDLADLRVDIPKVDSYLYSMLLQCERGGLAPSKASSALTPVNHVRLCQELAVDDIKTAAESLIALLNTSPLDIGEDAPDLQRFSIFSGVPCAARDAFLERVLEDHLVDRAVGAMVGMAVGDAVGQPLEFVPACKPGHSFDPETLIYAGIHNAQNLKPGQWTDDASMGLCIADSLLVRKSYDGSDIRVRFWNWWFKGYDNAFRKELGRSGSVGLGGNIANSFAEIRQGAPNAPPPRYAAEGDDSGNGSLMRLAPIPIFFHQDLAAAVWHSRESSYTTHPGATAADLCGFLGHIICHALSRDPELQTAAEFLDACVKGYIDQMGLHHSSSVLARLLRGTEVAGSTEICWNWRDPAGPFIAEAISARGGSYNGYAFSAEYFGSYAPDGLALALHSVYHTQSFTEAIARSVNFLGDADSHGSITGQIAGAFYGYHEIDPRCISNLERWDDREVALRGALLCLMAHG